MKKYFLLLAAVILATTARGAINDIFEYDGLQYRVTSDTDLTVEVAENNSITGDIVIPAAVSHYGVDYTVTRIGTEAFRSCHDLTSVVMPETMTVIGLRAFYYCRNLKSVNLPDAVTTIDNNAFCFCDKLTSVYIPKSVTSIGANPFSGCDDMTEIKVAAGNENFCSYDGVLYDSNKTTLILCPQGKTRVSIPATVKTIGEAAFVDCSKLTSINIPESVTDIGERAFLRCGALTSIYIPASVTEIGEEAFSGCISLTSINIPASVTEIGESAFSGCSSIKRIAAQSTTPPPANYMTFREIHNNAVIYVPKGSAEAYKADPVWSYFRDIREMGLFSLSLNVSEISIARGKSAEITGIIEKSDDVDVESATWSTSDARVATVDNGEVTAVGPGTATVTYTVVDGYGLTHTASCKVKVINAIKIERITLK